MNNYPLPPETGCQGTYVSLPITDAHGKAESLTATVDGQMSAAACRWLAAKLDNITSPPQFLVIGDWPDFGVRIWDRRVFDSVEDAKQAWEVYVSEGQDGELLEAKLVRIATVVLSDA